MSSRLINPFCIKNPCCNVRDDHAIGDLDQFWIASFFFFSTTDHDQGRNHLFCVKLLIPIGRDLEEIDNKLGN